MSETMELAEVPQGAMQTLRATVQTVAQPITLLERAMERGATLEQMREIMALQERQQANDARKAFVAAMAAFKKDAPEITKTKKVEHSGISYMHATLGNVVQIISKKLGEYGFSVRFKTDQPGDGRIIVTCILTHDMGHSETDVFEGPADTSGKKNPTQGIASAISYGRRYTILGVTGLATLDQEDDDGQAAGAGAVGKVTEAITDALLADLAKTTTDADAAALWRSGSKSLHATGIVQAYEEFKAAVVAHRRKLAEGKA